MRQATPLFIVGVGRSGTSLLQSMLHAHPSVSFLPETHFFRQYVARPLHRARFERMSWAEFAAVLENDEHFGRAVLEVDELIGSVSTRTAGADTALVYREMLRLHGERCGVPVVGDKDPRNIDYFRSLYKCFPSATVLHIMRDPRDVMLSRKKAAWSSGRPLWLQALIYNAQIRGGRKWGPRLFGKAYVELRYEDLITRPRATLERICHQCGIDFDERMLSSFGESARDLVNEREMQWKKETLGPLLSDNFEKWRKQLPPEEIRLAERLCPVAFDELGYDISEHSGSGGWPLQGPVSRPFTRLFEALYPALTQLR